MLLRRTLGKTRSRGERLHKVDADDELKDQQSTSDTDAHSASPELDVDADLN